MLTTRLTAPTFPAISNDDIAEWLRLDSGTDETTLALLVSSATEVVEQISGQTILQAAYKIEFSEIAYCYPLGLFPVQSITSVSYTDDAGDELAIDGFVMLPSRSPAVVLSAPPLDADRITITVQAGYADAASIPDSLRHAIAVLVSAGYDGRQNIPDATMATVERLCARHRRIVL